MDTSLPPLECAQCHKPINVGEPLTAINESDPETGEPVQVATLVVHEGCFEDWEREHGGQPG